MILTFSAISANAAVPTIISISPSAKIVGDPGFYLIVNGTNFASTSTVNFNGSSRATTFFDPTKLLASIPGSEAGPLSDLKTAGAYPITVFNPGPGGGTSNSRIFTVTSNNKPFVSNLKLSDSGCMDIPESGVVFSSWEYNSGSGNDENQFQFQMTNTGDPGFISPAVNRTFDNLSNSPGSLNQQAVFINRVSASDSIAFNSPYFERVKVWDSTGLDSDWAQDPTTYEKTGHPNPVPSFTWSRLGSVVTFTDHSTCYNNSGPTACTSYLWDFGDGCIIGPGSGAIPGGNCATGTFQILDHPYSNQGTYNVILKVFDDSGYCGTSKLILFKIGENLPIFKEITPF